jgi:hypothetical protein
MFLLSIPPGGIEICSSYSKTGCASLNVTGVKKYIKNPETIRKAPINERNLRMNLFLAEKALKRR